MTSDILSRLYIEPYSHEEPLSVGSFGHTLLVSELHSLWSLTCCVHFTGKVLESKRAKDAAAPALFSRSAIGLAYRIGLHSDFALLRGRSARHLFHDLCAPLNRHTKVGCRPICPQGGD